MRINQSLWARGLWVTRFVMGAADAVGAQQLTMQAPLDLERVTPILANPNNRGIIMGPLNDAANDPWEIATRGNDGFDAPATELLAGFPRRLKRQ